MSAPRYTVKYGRAGRRRRYTHAHSGDLDHAKRLRDNWHEGGAWGGVPPAELRVWVEDKDGAVVYGEAP